LLPTLGININTHICGQTAEVSKSLIIPGILSPEECDKCHKVVIVKSCCSNKEVKVEETTGEDKNEKGCCQDILEYNDYDYLTITPYVLSIDFSSVSFIVSETYSVLNTQDLTRKTIILDTRRRPYIVDIHTFICTYLI
jgi:hypothetical protein